MAKSRVKGITIEIGGNTVGLDKALAGTNKNIGTTQSRLKDVERLLKLDPKNTVLLEQKQELLAQAVHETEQKLRTLNEANDQVADSVKNYDAWKQAYDPIQEEISTTQEKLKKLKAEQAELKDCGEVDTDAYQKLQEEAEETSRRLRELKERAKEVNDQFDNPVNPDQYAALQREIVETELALKDLKAKGVESLNWVKDAFIEAEEAAINMSKAVDNAKDKTSTFGDVLKAEAIVEGAKGVAEAMRDVSEETKEYRKIMGSLEVSSAAAGYSAEETETAYKKLYGILADDQSTATTVANLQALRLPQEKLLELIDHTVGGWAKYGDSIPIDGLAEAINETAKTGQVTGNFADILNWASLEGETFGVSLKENIEFAELSAKELEALTDRQREEYEATKAQYEAIEDFNKGVADATTAEDMFNIALGQCATEAERIELIMQTMASQGLDAAADKWRENNESMVEANETAADMQEQLAILGETVEPMITRLTALVVDALEWFNGLDEGTQDFIITSVLLVAALGPVLAGISGVCGIVEKLSGGEMPKLFGVFDKLTGTVLPGVQGAFSSTFGFIAANPVVLLIGAIVGMVALFATKGDEIQEKLQQVDDFLQGVFAKDWTEVFGPILGGALNDFFELCKGIWDSLKKILDGCIDFIRGVFTGDWERAWRGVVGIFEGVFSGLETLLKAPINGVIGLVNSAISGINWLIEGVNKIPGVNLDTIGKIPYLAEGGEVFRGSAIVGEAGPELMTVLGDRTVVQPLTNSTTHNAYMGGMTLNVYGAPGQDVRELAELVMEEMENVYEQEDAAL